MSSAGLRSRDRCSAFSAAFWHYLDNFLRPDIRNTPEANAARDATKETEKALGATPFDVFVIKLDHQRAMCGESGPYAIFSTRALAEAALSRKEHKKWRDMGYRVVAISGDEFIAARSWTRLDQEQLFFRE